MEGGAGGGAGQGQRERRKAGRQTQAGEGAGGRVGMKFQVSARAPHGVAALLLVGGAVVAGAAFVAWRHARRSRRGPQPAKQEAVGGGVVEDGKGDASALEMDQLADDDVRREKENARIESNGLDNDGVTTEEVQEVNYDTEIVANEPKNELVEKLDLDATSSLPEISTHGDADSEPVEKLDQEPSTKLPEIIAHDTESVTLEKGDENSVKKDTESDHNSTKHDDTENDQDGITDSTENENPSKNDLEKERGLNDNEEVEASDQCSHTMSRQVVVLDEQGPNGDDAQDAESTETSPPAESMETSPAAELITHQEQLSDDTTTMDADGEAAAAKPGNTTVPDNDVTKPPGQENATSDPAGLAGSPAVSPPPLVKPKEEGKELEPPGRVETGMKIEQDYTHGAGLKELGPIRKGGRALLTVDRRSHPSMAVLALMLTLAVGIAIVVRFYATPRATTQLLTGSP